MPSVPDHIFTARLRLRRPVATDEEAVFDYASDFEVTRFMDWPTHRSRTETAAFLQRCAPLWNLDEEFTWAVTLRHQDRPIGAISCRIHAHKADFGYVL